MPIVSSDISNKARSYSGAPVDKIVRIFSGSYNRATDVTGRTFTLSGFPTTTYFYRIAHGLGRPVACEMIDSEDGGTSYYDGGIRRIAVSDSTYIYIFDSIAAPGAGTVNYKVWCNWIDDYDSTNPSIEAISYTTVPTQYDSRENYQKVYDQNVLTFSPGTFASDETQIVTHDLGTNPNAKVWYEAFSGEVWPLNAAGFFQVSDTQEEAELFITSVNIRITMYRRSNQNRRAWYKIYYDSNQA